MEYHADGNFGLVDNFSKARCHWTNGAKSWRYTGKTWANPR